MVHRPRSSSPTTSGHTKRGKTWVERTVQILGRIHDVIDRAARHRSQQDFSVVRLFGALIQMLAIATAIWGSLTLMSDDPLATPRLLLACFLQLAALTAFAIDRVK